MIRKISILAAGAALVVVMSMLTNFNASNVQQGDQVFPGSIIQVAKANPSYNHKKSCFLREGCKFKVDRNCFGGMCGSNEQ